MTINWTPPKIENAPGIRWRKFVRVGWEARWQCRHDIKKRGFALKSLRVWFGKEPPLDWECRDIADKCSLLQQEMLVWNRRNTGREIPEGPVEFDGTLRSLIQCYQTDQDSGYQKLRYATKCQYNTNCARLANEHGDMLLIDIKARELQRWHGLWSVGGRVALAHGLIGMLRTLFSFGMTLLESEQCERLSMILHKMRFKMPPARQERLTADQASAVRARAHAKGKGSIALAQALQFEGMLRQKDVIGEWVPLAERGTSEIFLGDKKWLMGARWSEIDDALVLRHVTSKRGKLIEIDLTLSPMVLEEFAAAYPDFITRGRAALPASGPIIVCERTGLPYVAHQFRREWRELATEAGVPKHVRNMDTRAGAISEATDAGAELEHVRHAATHSDISMTARYSRNTANKVAEVQRIRTAHRNKSGRESA